jgi:acyl carrier protein
MDKNSILNELKDVLEIEDEVINEESGVHLTSLSKLSVMAFIYENFEKQIKPSELENINKIQDLMDLIGSENMD